MEGQKINMLCIASNLIGKDDAKSWWKRYSMIFTHPLFITDKNISFDGTDTVWAHPHPDLKRSFGVYIVKHGSHIVYEGRSENQVAWCLGILHKL